MRERFGTDLADETWQAIAEACSRGEFRTIERTASTGCVVYEVPLVLQSGAELLAGVVWSPATSAIVTVYGHDAGGIDGPSLEAATLRDLAVALDAERARMREALGLLRRGRYARAQDVLKAAEGTR